jgi:nucleotide-binding universal stress UspA family protein
MRDLPMKLERILAATDLSETSRSGLRYAMNMALERDAELVVLYVIGEDGDWFDKDDALNPAAALLPEYERQLAEFIRETCADSRSEMKLRPAVEAGIPYKEIVRTAAEEKVNMIVMSTHGRTGLDRFMVGSVTEQVIAHAPCPVLAIPPPGKR